MVPGARLELARPKRSRDFKSLVSTDFTTRALGFDESSPNEKAFYRSYKFSQHKFYNLLLTGYCLSNYEDDYAFLFLKADKAIDVMFVMM